MKQEAIVAGKVALVGAGPGDPDLITLRGIECLEQADLVFYDVSARSVIDDHHFPLAKKIRRVVLSDSAEESACGREDLADRLIEAAEQGLFAVYLASGDSMVFGGGASLAKQLRAAGVVVEIVPGVLSALAVACYAEIPITHGLYASAVALVAAGEQVDALGGGPVDFAAMAGFPGTLVISLAGALVSDWVDVLLAAGKPADTPAAVVGRCSLPGQTTVRGTLATVPEVLAGGQVESPAVVVVGQVADLAPAASWFVSRPLFGKRIMVTRPREQAGDLAERLRDLGAEVLWQPAIEIVDPPDFGPLDRALADLQRYDWIVFSSVNGVKYFVDRLFARGGDIRRLGYSRIAAVGATTAEALGQYHVQVDRIPEYFRAEALADALVSEARGRRFLLVRASRGRQVLSERLSAAGADVHQVVAYTSRDVVEADPAVLESLDSGAVDWITVTSSAIAQALVRLFGERLRKTRLASISPITSQTLRELGFEPAVEASEYTAEGLLAAIVEGEAGSQG